MIEYVKLDNLTGEPPLKVVLKDDKPSHGLMVQKIDGLGGIQSTINTTDYAISDGSYLSSRRVGNRNVVIDFRLTDSAGPNNTFNVENSRLRLYRYAQLKQKVRFLVKTDTLDDYIYLYQEGLTAFDPNTTYYERSGNSPSTYTYAPTTDTQVQQGKHYYVRDDMQKYIDGYVDKADPDVFSNKENVQVSIICNDPYFKIHRYEAIGGSMKIQYNGTAETGFIIYCKPEIISDITYITINDIKLKVDTIASIVGNAWSSMGTIIIDSRVGHKTIQYVNGSTWNIIKAAGILPIKWPTLKYGENEIVVKYDSRTAPINSSNWVNDSTEVYDDNPPDTYPLMYEVDEAYGGI